MAVGDQLHLQLRRREQRDLAKRDHGPRGAPPQLLPREVSAAVTSAAMDASRRNPIRESAYTPAGVTGTCSRTVAAIELAISVMVAPAEGAPFVLHRTAELSAGGAAGATKFAV